MDPDFNTSDYLDKFICQGNPVEAFEKEHNSDNNTLTPEQKNAVKTALENIVRVTSEFSGNLRRKLLERTVSSLQSRLKNITILYIQLSMN